MEIKTALRKAIKKCDICGCQNFRFVYDEYWQGIILVNCKYCGNRLYIGDGQKVN